MFCLFHKYKLVEQKTVLFSNINVYNCKYCPKVKVEYELGGKVFQKQYYYEKKPKISLHPNFFKKQGEELLEK